MSYWSEIRNNHRDYDITDQGKIRDIIYIDAWKENEEESSIIAQVFRTDKNELGVIYCDTMAAMDYLAQEKISEAFLTFAREIDGVDHSDEDFMTKRNDYIYKMVFDAINAVAHWNNPIEWDMKIISEITDEIETALVRRNINVCYPYIDEDENMRCSSEGRCPYCIREEK